MFRSVTCSTLLDVSNRNSSGSRQHKHATGPRSVDGAFWREDAHYNAVRARLLRRSNITENYLRLNIQQHDGHGDQQPSYSI
jgi:hypothetical protein